MTTVVIVDDHPVVRAGLTARLATRPGIEVVGEAGGGSAALAVVGRERPDVVLMDLQLGADNGVAVTRELLRRDPRARVLILTTYDTDADIVAARGEAVFAPAVAGRLARRVVAPPNELTEREREVVALLAEGLANRQIARRLFLSEATVKTHLVHVYEKLHVDNRTAAVAAARQAGIIR